MVSDRAFMKNPGSHQPTRADLENVGKVGGCPAKGCRCKWHTLSRKPPEVQLAASRERLATSTWGELRIPKEQWPEGERPCYGCKSFVPLFYTTGSKCKACTIEARRTAAFGVTPDQQAELSKIQGGLCAGCRKHQRIKALATDHDHFTNLVRGFLCLNCNQTIGDFHDNALQFLRLAMYLVNPPARKIGIGDPPLTDLETAQKIVKMMKIIFAERNE